MTARCAVRGHVSTLVFAGSIGLVACGGSARLTAPDAQAGASSVAGSSAAGGAVGSGAAGSSGPVVMSAGSGGAPPPPADISGSWGMFSFEDPVGVLLIQQGGSLRGAGCASGVPGASELNQSYCGDLGGEVRGPQAQFGFNFGPAGDRYSAEVTVSEDGQRMAGRFHAFESNLPTAWLRVPPGQVWLPSPESRPPEAGRYELRLTSSDGNGREYELNRIYSLSYFHTGIAGDLGSFFHTEIARAPESHRIVVGPVPATLAELPVSLTLDVADQQLKQVTAVTASGHHFTFDARLTPGT